MRQRVVIERGETFALVGESGSGKTTSARILAGLLAAGSGSIEIDGRPLRSAARSDDDSPGIQMVFQDPYASLNPRWQVGRIVGEPIRNLHRPERERRVRPPLSMIAEPPWHTDAVGGGAIIDALQKALSDGQIVAIRVSLKAHSN